LDQAFLRRLRCLKRQIASAKFDPAAVVLTPMDSWSPAFWARKMVMLRTLKMKSQEWAELRWKWLG
jgi:hypothetical protein